MKTSPYQLASVFAHPLRANLILLLAADGPRSPNQLATALGERLGNVSYHITILRDGDVIALVNQRHVRGAIEHFYALTDEDQVRKVAAALGLELPGKDESP
jgi:DNA-binding transcriptional ArsR family regulator